MTSDTISGAGRAAHAVALGTLIGGNLFGRYAMHPALTDVSDKSERGRVLNRAWRRYGTVNSVALATVVAGWLPARLRDGQPPARSARERRLAQAEDVAVGAVVLTGVASAVGGVRFAHQAPGGRVPMASGRDPDQDTPPRAARIKRLLTLMGALSLLSEVALAAINAALAPSQLRRAPARRLLRRA